MSRRVRSAGAGRAAPWHSGRHPHPVLFPVIWAPTFVLLAWSHRRTERRRDAVERLALDHNNEDVLAIVRSARPLPGGGVPNDRILLQAAG